mmetsp:Transcript_2343/g.3432  ORF Transcript_2343/g.3432 Transcript_2343/m.3432 type:complete len:342 (+) Transcript_2343:28-1053(+)
MERRGGSLPFAPEEGVIERGKVTRIEPYGAFVQFERFRARGLVHISHLASYQVEKVKDAVNVNDDVWVKVLEVQKEIDDTTGKTRHKLRLSMKYASQDGSRKDLEEELTAGKRTYEKLEQNLTGTIGMGLALDPMAGFVSSNSGNKRITLRSKPNAQSTTVINGYALVNDTEGEPELPLDYSPGPSSAPAATEHTVMKPMGRGRGTTLPAWMTQKQQQEKNNDGPVVASATIEEDRRRRRSRTGSVTSSSEDTRSRSRRKKRKHNERKKHKPKDKTRGHRREDGKHYRRHRHHHHRRHSRYSDDSDNGGYDQSSNAKGDEFASVEEAKKLIADLENRKRKR